MRHSSYTEWLENSAKVAEDHPFQWLDFARKKKFDQRVIESRLQELKTTRVEGRADKLLFYFDEGLHGNMANMGAAEVYESSSQSARDLISEYVGELAEGLEQIYNLSDSELDPDVKRAFFDRVRRCHA